MPFEKGRSGNPGGKKKKTESERDFEKYCDGLLYAASAVIGEAIKSEDFDERRWAVDAVLDRTIGKALQRVESDNYNHEVDSLTDAQILEKLKVLQNEPIQITGSKDVARDSGLSPSA